MSEREGPSESDFWDGHNLKDDCPWKEIPGGPLYDFHKIVDAYREIGRGALYRDLLERLINFVNTGEGRPIKTLDEGDKFRLRDYPKGTIVRFGIDIDEATGRLRQRSLGEYEDNWGIITQYEFAGRYYDLFVGWTIDESGGGNTYQPDHQFSSFGEGDTIIGETVHMKLITPTFNPLTRFLQRNRWQTFIRITWLDVWKFGSEVRERKEEESSVFQTELVPKPIRNS